jgi:hypothetical protein
MESQTFCGVVTNAGKARLPWRRGRGERPVVESMAVAGDRLTLAGSLGYIDAEYREYVTNIAGRGPVGRREVPRGAEYAQVDRSAERWDTKCLWKTDA